MGDLKWKITEIVGNIEKLTIKDEEGNEIIPGNEYESSISSLKVYVEPPEEYEEFTITFSASTGSQKDLVIIRQCDGKSPIRPTGECDDDKWGSWGNWSNINSKLSCAGGDNSAVVTRYRVCTTDVNTKDEETKTVNLNSTTICNDGEVMVVYQQDDVTVYQAGGCNCGGPGPTPIECQPNDNTELNEYISNIVKSIATINYEDTPCTYEYLLDGLNFLKNDSRSDDITISWFLANMISELIPEVNKVSDFFNNAANKYGGVPGLNNNHTVNEEVYNKRIGAGALYALYKYENYGSSKELTTKAREELGTNLNTKSLASLTQSDAPHADGYMPTAPGQTSESTKYASPNTFDYDNMSYVLENSEELLENNNHEAQKDKQHCWNYICNIYGTPTTSNWTTYFEKGQEIQYQSSEYNKTLYPRFRPATCRLNQRDTEEIGYVCTTDESSMYICTMKNCQQQTEEFSQKTSYPSGHASLGYFCSLLYLEATGLNMTERGREYGLNRNIVRAHWFTDVLIGQCNSTACIGFLNGFKEFQDLIENVNPNILNN